MQRNLVTEDKMRVCLGVGEGENYKDDEETVSQMQM